MSNGIRIGIEADTSGVRAELAKVDAAAQRINSTLSSGAVGIDIAQAKRDLAALEEAAKTVADSLSKASGAEVDLVGKSAATSLREAAQAAADLDKVLEAIGQSTGASQVVRSAKEQADHIHRAARAHEVLSREGIKLSRAQAESAKASFDGWRRSGARGTSRIRDTEFDDWVSGGWRGHSIDQHEAERRRAEVLRTVGIDLGAPGGASRDGGALRRQIGAHAGAGAGILGGVAGAMLSGGGEGGALAAAGHGVGSLMGEGVRKIAGGPAGAIVGLFASQLLGGAGQAVGEALKRAMDEGGTFTDLRRSVGVVSTDFDELRESVRYFTDGLGLAYNESAKLAQQFARTANAQGGEGLGQEVGIGAGFARGYGTDPAASVRMMATMRHLGVTSNETESKRLALMIGEAVQRGGTTAKMDEVLSVLQSQASMQARASLSAPDVGAMASFMSSLTGLSMYGMKGDPTNAGAAMSAADAAMRQGGAFGEASKNFSLGLWQRQLSGFTALDMDFMNEQGAFGNIGKAFGRESAAYKLAESRGDKAKMAQYDQWAGQGGDRSVMAMQMQALEGEYGHDTDMFRKSIQSHFGVGAGQASALYQAYKTDRGLGGLEKQLAASGVDISRMNAKQVAALAEVALSDDSGVRKQADRLKGLDGADRLKGADAAALNKAMASGDENELRNVVVRLTAAYDSTRDEGERARQVQADMANNLQKLATELVPATLDIREGIADMVKGLVGETEFTRKLDAEKADREARAKEEAEIERRIAEKRKQIEGFAEDPAKAAQTATSYAQLKRQRDAAATAGRDTAGFDHNLRLLEEEMRRNSPQGLEDLKGQEADLQRQREALKSRPLSSNQDAVRQKILAEVKRQGGSDEDAAALLGLASVESGFRQSARGPVIDRGMHKGDRAAGVFQYMAKSSTGFNRFDEDQNIAAGVRDFLKNKERLGSAELAVAAHHAGPNHKDLERGVIPGTTDGNMSTRRYVEEVMGRAEGERRIVPELLAGESDGKVPAPLRETTAGGGGAQQVSLNVGGRFELYDQNGNQRAEPIIHTSFGAPRPAGVFA